MIARLLTVAALLALAACDCDGANFRGVEQFPVAGVEPSAIDHGHACKPADDTVRVTNTGEETLVVSDVVIEGPGWSLGALVLPASIEPRNSLAIPLSGTSGRALLRISTNDPIRPSLDVPLSIMANAPPTVAIQSPSAGAVVDDGLDLPLVAKVSDDADAPSSLVVRWTRSDGSLVTAVTPAESGLAAGAWAAEGRPHGPETLVATVTDACGLKASARVLVCLDGSYSYEPFKLEGWSYAGAAEYDAGAGYLRLTPALQTKSGSAFELSQTVRGGAVDITFGFFAGLGTGADGFSLTALDASRMTTTVGPQGCGIGYGGGAACTTGAPLPGWSVEVDTYYNAEVDPTPSQHVAFTFDGVLANQPLWAVLPRINDAAWHEMQVKVEAPHVTVRVDGTPYLDADVPGHFDFPAYLGFTASTGGLTDEHRIRALAVTGRYCDARP